MTEEVRDFEDLRAELDARMKELVEGRENHNAEPLEEGEPPRGGRPGPPALTVVHHPPCPEAEVHPAGSLPTLEEVERDYIVRVLEAMRWRISGPRGAARILGLNPSTLRSRMKKLGIRRYISRNR